MNRFLASLSTIALCAATASAQCFETSFGSLVGTGVGDDTLFATQPLNISFPMTGGTFPAYTHAGINTNGAMFLWNAAAGILGATGTGYSTSAATQLTNLRGAVGGSARIAPLWRDLNILAANGGGVWLNNTLPGKCVVTWANAVQFGSAAPIFTVQAQLFATGEVKFFYSGTAASSSATIVGVSRGNAVVSVPGVDLCPGPNTGSTSQLMYQQFLANTLDLSNRSVSFVPNGTGGYDESCSACIPAFNQNYGSGCYNYFASFYQSFPTAAAAAPALSGTSISMTYTGTGYTVATGSAALFPTTGAVSLVLGDDTDIDAPAPLSSPLSFPGGTTSLLRICSNGYVAAAAGNSLTFNVSPALMLGNPQAGWNVWHDMNPSILGSGQVKYEEVGGIAYVTYDGVWDFAGTSPADANTWQFQFNLSNGNINIVFGTLSPLGASGIGYVVGWSPAGPSANPGSITLPPATPFTTSADAPGLALAASPNPVSTGSLGTTMTYTSSNIPEAQPASGIYLSTTILSLGQDLPGTDLGPMAPGCKQYFTTADVFLAPAMLLGPTDSQTFGIPAGVAPGFEFYAQSIALVVPGSLPGGLNPGGLVSSNGVRSVINNF